MSGHFQLYIIDLLTMSSIEHDARTNHGHWGQPPYHTSIKDKYHDNEKKKLLVEMYTLVISGSSTLCFINRVIHFQKSCFSTYLEQLNLAAS